MPLDPGRPGWAYDLDERAEPVVNPDGTPASTTFAAFGLCPHGSDPDRSAADCRVSGLCEPATCDGYTPEGIVRMGGTR